MCLERLIPVNVWLPVAPDLASRLLGKEGYDTEKDDDDKTADYSNGLGKTDAILSSPQTR